MLTKLIAGGMLVTSGFIAFPIVTLLLLRRDEKAADRAREEHEYGAGGAAWTPRTFKP